MAKAKRKTASRRGHRSGEPESTRPSLFFIVALAAGLILLIWLAVRGFNQLEPAAPPETPPATASP